MSRKTHLGAWKVEGHNTFSRYVKGNGMLVLERMGVHTDGIKCAGCGNAIPVGHLTYLHQASGRYYDCLACAEYDWVGFQRGLPFKETLI